MLGNFTYCNPTRLRFGEQALEQLAAELKTYARYFVGNSYLAPLSGSRVGVFNVTFEPVSRAQYETLK